LTDGKKKFHEDCCEDDLKAAASELMDELGEEKIGEG